MCWEDTVEVCVRGMQGVCYACKDLTGHLLLWLLLPQREWDTRDTASQSDRDRQTNTERRTKPHRRKARQKEIKCD